MRKTIHLLLCCTVLAVALPFSRLAAQDNVKVMVYNLLRYGCQGIGGCTPTGVTARNAWLSAILNEAQPDVFGVNEIGPFNGPTSPASNILNNILKPINPSYEAANVTFSSGQDIANAFFYNGAKLGLKSQAVIPHSFRNIDYYKLYYKGPSLPMGDTTWLEVVVVHLSADNAATRASQTEAIMNYLNALGRPGNFIVMGDFNLDGSGATAYQNMVAHVNANVKMNDPINLSGTWSNNNNAKHAWSQSTRSSGSNDCGSGGGLDDRFDIILCSNSLMNNTDDIRYVPSSYRVFGNPYAPNPAVGSAAAAALAPMSDHHPVLLTLEVSRAVSTTPARAGLDLRILGNPAQNSLEARLDVSQEMVGQWSFALRDLRGRTLVQSTGMLNAGVQTVSLSTEAIAEGLYLFEVTSPWGNKRTERIQVLHP